MLWLQAIKRMQQEPTEAELMIVRFVSPCLMNTPGCMGKQHESRPCKSDHDVMRGSQMPCQSMLGSVM